jgi:hypothetical protein
MFSELEACKILGWTDTKMMLRYAIQMPRISRAPSGSTPSAR